MRKWTLALLAVAGCGEYNFTPIPQCSNSQVLTGDGKNLSCVEVAGRSGGGGDGGSNGGADLSGGGSSPDLAGTGGNVLTRQDVPACTAGKCLTGDNAGMLSCVDVSQNNMVLQQLINDVTSLKNRVTALEMGMGGGGGSAKYVGVTMATTSGRIVHANADIGIASAAAMCNDQFVGAHMCTMQEMYESVAAGVLKANATVPKSWVYAPSWQHPAGPTPNLIGDNAGVGDNCASYTYPTADQKWTGVAVEWKPTPAPQGAANALIWWGGAAAPCNAVLPVACCK